MGVMNMIKRKIRTWLNVKEASSITYNVDEAYTFEGNAFQNEMWYRGKSNELKQFYSQSPANSTMFWSASQEAKVRHIHSGIPQIIVNILAKIIIRDLNGIEFTEIAKETIWEDIEKENKFKKLLRKAVTKALYIGDGAFKISLDSNLSQYPIIEFYGGDKVDFHYERGRYLETEFRKIISEGGRDYCLTETYGYGYITYKLYNSEDNEIKLDSLKATEGLKNVMFDKSVNLAIPFMINESGSYEGRGASIYDGKIENFDALDECISQWHEAVRKGRAKKYIPECMLPHDPENGNTLNLGEFDDDFISIDSGDKENDKNEIKLVQPAIPTDNYLQTYITDLDLCLQGIISPSTLGIDTKKLDNADAQREKEKTTLYTRNEIIEAIDETIPELINVVFKAINITNGQPLTETECHTVFGEYATPSFEAQVETIAKAKTAGIMSVEAGVEELYGDTKDDEWKQEEVQRIKEEMGITELNEPSVNMDSEIN